MKITWLGHASFLIESSDKTVVLTDPFDETVGYKVYNGHADVVTVSHHHFDHDNVRNIQGDFTIIDTPGSLKLKGITINGIASYHDKLNGAKRGSNIVFVIDIDGFKICHLGDLGHILDDNLIQQIGKIDVLLIPVGGNFTIDGKEAASVAKSINSSIIIPMHYKTACLAFPLDGVESFITNMKNGENLDSSTLEFSSSVEQINLVKILRPSNI